MVMKDFMKFLIVVLLLSGLSRTAWGQATAQISGTEHDVNEAWRADITLSVKK